MGIICAPKAIHSFFSCNYAILHCSQALLYPHLLVYTNIDESASSQNVGGFLIYFASQPLPGLKTNCLLQPMLLTTSQFLINCITLLSHPTSA